MPGFFGSLINQATAGAAAYGQGQFAGQEKRRTDDAARRKEILEHAILTLKTEQDTQHATDEHQRLGDEHQSSLDGRWEKVEGGDGFWHYVNRDTGADRPTSIRLPLKQPSDPYGGRTRAQWLQDQADDANVHAKASATYRAPHEPTVADDNRSRRKISDYALLLAREGAGATPGSAPSLEHMTQIMTAQFPDADTTEIASLASDALQRATTERHTRSGEPAAGNSMDDIRTALSGMAGGDTPPATKPGLKPRIPQASAAPAPAAPRVPPTVGQRALELQKSGMSEDQVVAKLRSEGLIH